MTKVWCLFFDVNYEGRDLEIIFSEFPTFNKLKELIIQHRIVKLTDKAIQQLLDKKYYRIRNSPYSYSLEEWSLS